MMPGDTYSKILFRGIINGVSRQDYDGLRALYERLRQRERIFVSEVHWGDARGGSITVNVTVYRDRDQEIKEFGKELFSRIADCICPGKYGLLFYAAGDIAEIGYIFFGHKQFEWKRFGIDFPEWWAEQRRTMVEWDKLFEL
jgi:hypothetical protein